jgi:ribosomal protein S18
MSGDPTVLDKIASTFLQNMNPLDYEQDVVEIHEFMNKKFNINLTELTKQFEPKQNHVSKEKRMSRQIPPENQDLL